MRGAVRGAARLLSVVVVVAAIVFASKSARACGRGGYGLEGLAYVAAAGVVVAGTVVITNTTFTVYDSVHAQTSNPPTIGWAATERWASTTEVVIGGLVGASMVSSRDGISSFPIVLAWTTWPAALMAHGFYAHEADPYGDGWQAPIAVVGTIDALLGVYDVGVGVTGRHVDDWYSVGEILGALPQFAFGLAYAGETGGRDGRTALLFTALPTALLVHGVVELAVPERHDDPPPVPSQGPATGLAPTFAPTFIPTFVVQGARGPAPGLALNALF
jgi:hypothetical protein